MYPLLFLFHPSSLPGARYSLPFASSAAMLGDEISCRPACAVSSGARATVCVHWPSERTEDDEVPHSYFHLTKNNYYVDGAMLSEPAWLILKQDAAQGVLK